MAISRISKKKSKQFRKSKKSKQSKKISKHYEDKEEDKDDLRHQRKITTQIITMANNLKKFKMFYKKLFKNEKETLQDYKYSGYIEINKYLYEGLKMKEFRIDNLFINNIKKYFSANTKSIVDLQSINPGNIKPFIELYVNKKIVEQINTIDKIFKHPNIINLTGNEILYRGTHGHSFTNAKHKIGDIVVSKNFMSCSIEQNISEFFAKPTFKDKIKIKILFVVCM